MASNFGFHCRTCGKFHAELPMSYSAVVRAGFELIPEEERAARCDLTQEFFMIDERDFYIRGCLEIPVIDGADPFVWSVWVSLSFNSFQRMCEHWESADRQHEAPCFGWLCTAVPLYPEKLHLKSMVHPRATGLRPFVELEPTDHPLAIEQRCGVTMNRVREIAETILYKVYV